MQGNHFCRCRVWQKGHGPGGAIFSGGSYCNCLLTWGIAELWSWPLKQQQASWFSGFRAHPEWLWLEAAVYLTTDLCSVYFIFTPRNSAWNPFLWASQLSCVLWINPFLLALEEVDPTVHTCKPWPSSGGNSHEKTHMTWEIRAEKVTGGGGKQRAWG